MILRKWFNSRKQNNSDEQNSWYVALFAQTCCWMYANIFSCCAFCTRHMQFAYLHWSWWQQTRLASVCIYNVSCWREWLFCPTSTRSKCVVFNRPLKTLTKLTAKKYVFLYEARLTYKSSNLLSVVLLFSVEIICKCTNIDVSLSFTALLLKMVKSHQQQFLSKLSLA